MNNGFEVHFFGGNEGKALFQVIAQLVAKYAAGTCACAVFFICAMLQHMPEKIVVVLHILQQGGKIGNARELVPIDSLKSRNTALKYVTSRSIGKRV